VIDQSGGGRACRLTVEIPAEGRVSVRGTAGAL
jgi:hypothetical protein